MISSQVPVSGNIAKMCQWEKESVSRGMIWYDAFHVEAIDPPAPTSNKKKERKGNLYEKTCGMLLLLNPKIEYKILSDLSPLKKSV